MDTFFEHHEKKKSELPPPQLWEKFGYASLPKKNLAPPDRSVEFVPLEAHRSSATLPPPKRAKRNGRFGAPQREKKREENRWGIDQISDST